MGVSSLTSARPNRRAFLLVGTLSQALLAQGIAEMDINFGLKPGALLDTPISDGELQRIEHTNDIMSRMLAAAAAYRNKAGPANQPFIVDKLKVAGFPMDQITDWLPHLMFHLGSGTEEML